LGDFRMEKSGSPGGTGLFGDRGNWPRALNRASPRVRSCGQDRRSPESCQKRKRGDFQEKRGNNNAQWPLSGNKKGGGGIGRTLCASWKAATGGASASSLKTPPSRKKEKREGPNKGRQRLPGRNGMTSVIFKINRWKAVFFKGRGKSNDRIKVGGENEKIVVSKLRHPGCARIESPKGEDERLFQGGKAKKENKGKKGFPEKSPFKEKAGQPQEGNKAKKKETRG